MDAQNYYDFLGISQEADEAQILKAIANIEKKDKDRRHASRLLTIKHTLTDTNRRRIYDRMVQQLPPAKSIDTTHDIGAQAAASQRNSSAADSLSTRVRDMARSSTEKSDQYDFRPAHQPAHVDDNESPHAPPRYHKERITAAWLSFFGGGLGLHRFWLGQVKLGVIYIVINFIFQGFLTLAVLVESMTILLTSDEKWRQKYGDYPSNYPGKDKDAAAILAFITGFIGVHHYYLRQWKIGLLYTLFAWTLIPFILGIFNGVSYMQMSVDDWNARYGHLKNRPSGCLGVLLIPLGIAIAVLGLIMWPHLEQDINLRNIFR